MIKISCSILALMLNANVAKAQNANLTKAQKDSIWFAQLKTKEIYPLISKWGGVLLTEVTEKPDTNRQYKLLFELIYGRYDSVSAKTVNSSLNAMARIINLHAAAGIPKGKLSVIGVVHANGLDAFLNNEKYREKYGVENPNMALLKEYLDLGIRFIACGQTLEMNGRTRKDFIPELSIALTAQTVRSEYLGKGYVQF